MSGLYAIVDTDALSAASVPVVAFAERVLAARPASLQLRHKSGPAREYLELLRALAPRCRAAGVPLFANDRPDLAVLGGADGVHVGQEDLAPADVRRFAPGLRVGVSTHDPAQLAEALAARPDYVAFGPVFPTRSKAKPDATVGVEGLRGAHAACRAAGVPLVAIGGIDVDRAPLVAEHAEQAAVIGALLGPDGLEGVEERARALVAALAGPVTPRGA